MCSYVLLTGQSLAVPSSNSMDNIYIWSIGLETAREFTGRTTTTTNQPCQNNWNRLFSEEELPPIDSILSNMKSPVKIAANRGFDPKNNRLRTNKEIKRQGASQINCFTGKTCRELSACPHCQQRFKFRTSISKHVEVRRSKNILLLDARGLLTFHLGIPARIGSRFPLTW